MQKSHITFILVRPQMGENIGAAARGMANFGLFDLRLVDPRDGWPNAAAMANASGAFDMMPAPTLYDSVAESIHDCTHVYATTARPRDMRKNVQSPEEAAHQISMQANTSKIGILFGAERTGLTNEELSYANTIITAPVNPAFSSLNLGQSVLLIAYEIMKASMESQNPSSMMEPDANKATHEEIHIMIDRLVDLLEDKRFFRTADMKPTMVNNIRTMFLRSELSDQEVRTMHGIMSALIGKKL